jgi:hypothetical protein
MLQSCRIDHPFCAETGGSVDRRTLISLLLSLELNGMSA